MPLTSSWERFQFSVEKAYTVDTGRPGSGSNWQSGGSSPPRRRGPAVRGSPLSGPAAVAVHDDGNVPGRRQLRRFFL